MNITILIGNAGGRATLATTKKDVKVANFSLATTERYKDREGVAKKNTDWHRIAVFGPLADVVAKYVDKGTVVSVTGKLHTEAYNDEHGTARVSSTLHADLFEIMSGGKKAETPPEVKAPSVGDICPKCNIGKFVKKISSGKPFLACDHYPECKNTSAFTSKS